VRYIRKTSRDAQRRPAAGRCGHCGRELWPGDSCWRISGVLLCKACLLDYALGLFAPQREEMGP